MESKQPNQVPIQDPRAELDQLCNHLAAVKTQIEESRETKTKIEERIASLVGVKEEGSISQKTPTYRITTTGSLTRSLELHDPEVYRAQLGDRFEKLVRTKLSINMAEFRIATPGEQAVLMEHMIIKPRRTAVKIEPREES